MKVATRKRTRAGCRRSCRSGNRIVYFYDQEARTTAIRSKTAEQESFSWDSTGMKRQQGTDDYVFDGANLLCVTDSIGSLDKASGYGPQIAPGVGGLDYQYEDGAGVPVHLEDQVGTGGLVLDSDEAEVTDYNFKSPDLSTFGEGEINPIADGSRVLSEKQFVNPAAGGGERPVGVYDFGARLYDPSLGIFLVPDPLVTGIGVVGLGVADRRGKSSHGFVHGDPVNLVDPFGLQVSTALDHIELLEKKKDYDVHHGREHQVGLAAEIYGAKQYLHGVLEMLEGEDLSHRSSAQIQLELDAINSRLGHYPNDRLADAINYRRLDLMQEVARRTGGAWRSPVTASRLANIGEAASASASNKPDRSHFYLKCVSECIEDQDPIDAVLAKMLLLLAGTPIPKSLVAILAEIAGDAKLAEKLRCRPLGAGGTTTMPSSLNLALKRAGVIKKGRALRVIGRVAGPVMVAYGLLLVMLEVNCAICCAFWRNYSRKRCGIVGQLEFLNKSTPLPRRSGPSSGGIPKWRMDAVREFGRGGWYIKSEEEYRRRLNPKPSRYRGHG